MPCLSSLRFFRRPSHIALFCALAFLWIRLVLDLRVDWSFYPQYAYGWAVPFLTAYLVFRKATAWRTFPWPDTARPRNR